MYSLRRFAYSLGMTDLSSYDLIIFDCDGTLADTELAHSAVMSRFLVSQGLTEYTPEKCMDTFMGKALPDIMDILETNHSVRITIDEAQGMNADYGRILKDYIKIDPATRPLLEKLHGRGQKMAVGSNGVRPNVIANIKAADFELFFPEDRIFTFEDVENPKPAPDLYLHICDVMHVKPENAVVIEDTVPGALAGIGGNIDTIGFTGLCHRAGQAERLREIGCKHVISSMEEFEEILYPQGLAA